jgi:GT2 family glycosyltransferase
MTRWLAPPPDGPVQPYGIPSFSVIIPTYEMADMVVDAVSSALNQTVPPHEVIVCDDGSTDDTQEVLRPFGDRIKVIRKQNGGLASAKNAAARVATGDFVAVLDADDIYLRGRMEALGKLAAARPDLDVLNTDVYLERDGVFLSRLTDELAFPVEDQRAAVLERCFMHSCAAIRRERLWDVDGFDESVDFADDWDCWVRLILSGSRAGLVDEPLALYRIHERAMSSSRVRDLAGRVRVMERASRNATLTPQERETVERSLRRVRTRFHLADAEQALRVGRPDVRKALLGVARGGAFPARTRAKALAGAVAPRAAQWFLATRERHGRRSRLSRPLADGPEHD